MTKIEDLHQLTADEYDPFFSGLAKKDILRGIAALENGEIEHDFYPKEKCYWLIESKNGNQNPHRPIIAYLAYVSGPFDHQLISFEFSHAMDIACRKRLEELGIKTVKNKDRI